MTLTSKKNEFIDEQHVRDDSVYGMITLACLSRLIVSLNDETYGSLLLEVSMREMSKDIYDTRRAIILDSFV